MEKEKKWFVVYVKSRHEKILAEQLTDSGFMVYLPMVKRLAIWSDRKKWVEEPLFKSYLFIREINDKAILKNFKSFVSFIQFNGRPAVVWQREIDTLKSVIKHGYDITEVEKEQLLETGNQVMIIGGPLKGMTGELYATEDENSFLISFENIGNSFLVKLPSKILKKIT